MTRALYDALEETLGFIQRALDRIQAGDAVEAELHNVRAYLLNILELVHRDPDIEAASDDYAVVKQFSGVPDRGTRMSRLLHEAFCASVTGSDRQGRAPRVSFLSRPLRRTRRRSLRRR